MSIAVVLILAALVGARPWRTQDERWFNESALLAALLLGGLLLTLS